MYLNRLAFKNISRVFVEKGDRGSVPNTGLSEDTLRGIPVYNRVFRPQWPRHVRSRSRTRGLQPRH